MRQITQDSPLSADMLKAKPPIKDDFAFMVERRGRSRRQGSSIGCADAFASLTAVFRVWQSSIHPDPNPQGLSPPNACKLITTIPRWISSLLWWSVGGSNSQAIAEHVEMKGGEHAIFFHPTKNPINPIKIQQ